MLNVTTIVLFIIGFLAVFGVTATIQISLQMKKWLRDIENAEIQNDSTTHTAPWIQNVMKEYKSYHLAGVSQVNTQALIEKHFYKESVPLFGFARVPAGGMMRFMQQLPPTSIIIGILGTFIGLTLAISSMQETLMFLSQKPEDANLNLASVIEAISSPFQGMSVAFITSIAGIGNALFLTLIQNGVLTNGRTTAYYLEKIISDCESLLDHNLNASLTQEKPHDEMERILDRLACRIQDSFHETLGDFSTNMVHFTAGLEQAMKDVQATLTAQREYTEQFSSSTETLESFGIKLKDSFTQLDGVQEKATNGIIDLGNRLKTLESQLQSLSKHHESGQRKFEQLVQRSDQLIKETQKKAEETGQHYLRGLDEQMQRFQGSQEELERRVHQMQDEWYYRYQDKQNQYGRASQEFAESVLQLEKAWYSSLDKIKREALEPIIHRMERDQRDQPLQHEMRAISNSLDSLYQGLARELKDIQHQLSESHQLQLRLYEEQMRRQSMAQQHVQSRMIGDNR
ncbi:hypothetical protein IQ283_07485 [Alkalihalobacillus hwajinpoensis]|uniref:hypothetical protein n=1 Tax=Guptibacillus hwajinpoensis TaxID=208199 RepID=UPI0018834FCF|nr:hypothetical protein [Pseudalkalibacillus hwajinpoensis]MBF0706451.1 hypothetical protein [Pseudalkalibacillus hwajinpoensis]